MIETNLLITAITGLAGCVAYLWKQAVDNHKAVMFKLTDCEEDRENLWREIANLNSKSGDKS